MSSRSAFNTCISFTRQEEGGYTWLHEDCGNWSSGIVGEGRLIGSNMGVSAPTLIGWHGRDDASSVTASTMQNLSETIYQAIARSRYWRSLGCDGLPPAIAMLVFDFGWNTGVGKSGRLLQQTIGLRGEFVDGDVGPKTAAVLAKPNWGAIAPDLTHAAVCELQQKTGIRADGAFGVVTSATLCKRPDLWDLGLTLAIGQAQIASYQALANFSTFGRGWIGRSERRIIAARGLLTDTNRVIGVS